MLASVRRRSFPGSLVGLSVLAAVAAASPLAMADKDHAEIIIGRNAAGQLRAMLDFPMPVELPENVFPGMVGWTDFLPGFASAFFDQPAIDLYMPDANSEIEFVLVSIGPGLNVLNDTGSGFMTAGQSYLLGIPAFDTHPIWNIPEGEHGEKFTAVLQILDRNHIHADSEPFTVTLTPAPACVGDFNDDGAVDTGDLVQFLARFGQTFEHGDPGHVYDLNHDGTVNTPDLTQFLSQFGQACH